MSEISSLRPYQKRVDVKGKILEKNEIREVQSKFDSKAHKVTEVSIGDSSGIILVTLWDDMIDKVEVGKSYDIKNGYTSLFKSSLRLNVGRYGELSEASEEVSGVDESNNISEKEFGQRSPRPG